MKNNIKKSLLLILVIFCALTSLYAEGSKEDPADKGVRTIIVGTEGTYKPYTYHDETGALTGYDVEIIQAIVAILGYQVKFEESRWDGLLAGLKSNRWDIVANQVWRNESREKEYLLSNKYLTAGASILVKADNPAKTSQDLKDKKATSSLTSSFRPYVEALTKNIEFQDDFILAVELLKSNRVDFVVNDTQTIGIYIKDNPQSGLKALPLDKAKTTDVVLALNKNNSALLQEVNDALAKLESNGTLDALNKKYFAGLK